jgi:hypothetical protein
MQTRRLRSSSRQDDDRSGWRGWVPFSPFKTLLERESEQEEREQLLIYHGLKEIARVMNRSVTTIKRWEKQFNLPVSYLPDGTRVISDSMIDAWLYSVRDAIKSRDQKTNRLIRLNKRTFTMEYQNGSEKSEND